MDYHCEQTLAESQGLHPVHKQDGFVIHTCWLKTALEMERWIPKSDWILC